MDFLKLFFLRTPYHYICLFTKEKMQNMEILIIAPTMVLYLVRMEAEEIFQLSEMFIPLTIIQLLLQS